MRKYTILILGLVWFGIGGAKAQYTIFTFAGNGTSGFSGDGGLAIDAELNYPSGIAPDSLTNVFICDYSNNRIRKVDYSTGDIINYGGNGVGGYSGDGGPATSAEMSGPYGIAVDQYGNLFIADQLNYRIRMINQAGIISTVAGNGVSGYSGDGFAATAAEMSTPYAVATDNKGNFYFSDNANNVVRKVNSSHIIGTVAGTGVSGFSGDGGAATSAQLFYPNGLSTDTLDNLYIVDEDNYRIRMVNSGGIINTIAGNGTAAYSGDGGPATDAELNYPTGISSDSGGQNIFIADFGNSRVRQIEVLSGNIFTIAGNGTPGFSGDYGMAVNAELNFPYSVATGSLSNVFIADYHNQRIRRIQILLGINDNKSKDNITTVYPNPSTGIFTIQASVVSDQCSVVVYNLLGEKVETECIPSLQKSQFSLDLSGQPNGIYFYRVLSEDGTIFGNGKMVIDR